jgi:ribose transport system ATP-binding protein
MPDTLPLPPAGAPQTVGIEFRNVSKRFGPVQALSDISFAGTGGTVHAVTGENGAGKSTLMKLLAGVHLADSGEIVIDGQPARFERPAQARAAGISTVFQELTLHPNLTIAENIFLGREFRKFGMIDRRAMRKAARAALERIGVDFDVDTTCGHMTISEQHIVEVAKAAVADSRIVIYDEPTAALDASGVDKLLKLIDEQKRAGKLVFYISHRLEEIFRLCDVTTVLKDGRHVATRPTADLTRNSLVSLMVGRDLDQMYPARPELSRKTDAALVADGFVAVAGSPAVSMEIRRGEIVGLAGIEGQGQRDIMRGLAGLIPFNGGAASKIGADGTVFPLGRSILATARLGLGFIPEDRKSEGLFQTLSIEQNMALGMLRTASMSSVAMIDRDRISSLMQKMQVRARNSQQLVSQLSGGNQQKVMFGRLLSAGVDILLVEEPTRGVDVGAKAEIYRLLRDFADDGGAILMTSSELTEHIGLCDRILVVREGSIVAELPGREATEESIMTYALMGDQAVVERA